jgi:DNA polymerase-3 subunit alpha/error-prone DNA polymerase
LIKRPYLHKPEFLNVSILYPIENTPDLLEILILGIRPEQLSMLFHPIWKSKLDKMVCITAGDFQDKKEFNLHKTFRQLTAMSFYQNLSKPITGTSETMVPLKNY